MGKLNHCYLESKLTKHEIIAHYLQKILSLSLLLLSIILIAFLIKETWVLIHILFSMPDSTASYLLIEGIIVWFLYFEFIALIAKYFQSNHHFPLRYFIYIGVTAIIRLIIVDHEKPMNTFIYSGAILILVVSLYLANTNLLKRT